MATITNIQRYSIHDGQGIRTTVFFKGCPLRCAWCHNPENLAFEPELMYYADRCNGCGACAASCPEDITMVSGRPQFARGTGLAARLNPSVCRQDALELAGQTAHIEAIVAACLRDQAFYEDSGGGVTLSGGEVMAQDIDFLRALTARLHKEGLDIAIDTCGHAPWEAFEAVLPYVSTFLYDIKLMDPQRHEAYVGVDNGLILANLKALSRAGATIHLRLPLMEGLNASPDDMTAIVDFLRESNIHPVRISLLPYHNTGTGKLSRLVGSPAPLSGQRFETPTGEKLEQLADLLRRSGLGPVSIGG